MTDKLKKNQNKAEIKQDQNPEAMNDENLMNEDGNVGAAGGMASDQDQYQEGDFEALGYTEEEMWLGSEDDDMTTSDEPKSASDDEDRM